MKKLPLINICCPWWHHTLYAFLKQTPVRYKVTSMFLGRAKAFKGKTVCYQMFLISFPTHGGKFTPGWKRKSGKQSKIIYISMQVHKLYLKNARHLMFNFRNSQMLKCQSFDTTICLFFIQHLKKIRTHGLNMKPIRICRMHLHFPHPSYTIQTMPLNV